MSREGKKNKLSKSILEMKFMKKSKEKAEKEQDDEEAHAMFADVLPKEILDAQSKFILESSYIPCEDLVEGRFSFQGMNPEIERLMEPIQDLNLDNSKNEKDVSDTEMADRYDSLVGTIAQKFKPKRIKEKVKNGRIFRDNMTKKFIKPPY